MIKKSILLAAKYTAANTGDSAIDIRLPSTLRTENMGLHLAYIAHGSATHYALHCLYRYHSHSSYHWNSDGTISVLIIIYKFVSQITL